MTDYINAIWMISLISMMSVCLAPILTWVIAVPSSQGES